MGMNFILPIIAGIIMMATLGASIGPSFVEQMKIKKVENRTISNQNLIKDAIVRYIKLEKKVPNDLEELKTSGLLKDQHETNLFDGGYEFEIDITKGTLKIFTTINDEGAGKYFSNSFKFPNAPTCIEFGQNGDCTGKFETFYLLDEDTLKSIQIPVVGSSESADEKYTIDNLGKKVEEGEELVDGYIDYVKNGDKITEYIYDKDNDEWVEGEDFDFEENKYVAGGISQKYISNKKLKKYLEEFMQVVQIFKEGYQPETPEFFTFGDVGAMSLNTTIVPHFQGYNNGFTSALHLYSGAFIYSAINKDFYYARNYNYDGKFAITLKLDLASNPSIDTYNYRDPEIESYFKEELKDYISGDGKELWLENCTNEDIYNENLGNNGTFLGCFTDLNWIE